MANKAHVQISNLPVIFLREGKYVVAYTPALDLTTQGKDLEQTKKRFQEIVEIFFEELARMDTLETTLSSLGWEKVNSKWNAPVIIEHGIQEVPINIQSNA